MFTGLVQDLGRVRSIEKSGDWRLVIETAFDMDLVPMGASICCSGCCLTVVEKFDGAFAVEVSAESLSKTNIGSWEEGRRINLEPSLKMGDELGGHFVFGHVDGLAELVSIQADGDSYRLQIKPPKNLMPYIASKGSIGLDGISLTVNEVEDDVFGVNIIPHTWEHTTLSDSQAGDMLNIEIDMLARYVARQMAAQGAGQEQAA